MADEYGTNVWEPELPEVWEGIRGRRLIREDGRRSAARSWSYLPDRGESTTTSITGRRSS
jgi:hypothetical protein